MVIDGETEIVGVVAPFDQRYVVCPRVYSCWISEAERERLYMATSSIFPLKYPLEP